MTTPSQLNPLSLADVKADASSFSGNVLRPAEYMIQSAAWPHLMLGLRNGAEEEGNPVDTILVLNGLGPIWNIEARPAGSTTTFVIQSGGGIFQRAESFSENAGIIGSATAGIFKLVQPHEDLPHFYSIQVEDGELAVQAVSGSGGDQVVLQPFDKQNTRQLWLLNRVIA